MDLHLILMSVKNQVSEPILQQQPVAVLVGPLVKIQAAYVIANDVVYPVPSALHAIDIAFKVCYCVDCNFPPNGYSLWMFLKTAFYKIDDAGDEVSSNIDELIGEIDSFLKRN